MIQITTLRTTIYSMNIDLIEKYDNEVRKKYPNAQINKIDESKIIWLDGHRVATLQLINGKPVFEIGI